MNADTEIDQEKIQTQPPSPAPAPVTLQNAFSFNNSRLDQLLPVNDAKDAPASAVVDLTTEPEKKPLKLVKKRPQPTIEKYFTPKKAKIAPTLSSDEQLLLSDVDEKNCSRSSLSSDELNAVHRTLLHYMLDPPDYLQIFATSEDHRHMIIRWVNEVVPRFKLLMKLRAVCTSWKTYIDATWPNGLLFNEAWIRIRHPWLCSNLPAMSALRAYGSGVGYIYIDALKGSGKSVFDKRETDNFEYFSDARQRAKQDNVWEHTYERRNLGVTLHRLVAGYFKEEIKLMYLQSDPKVLFDSDFVKEFESKQKYGSDMSRAWFRSIAHYFGFDPKSAAASRVFAYESFMDRMDQTLYQYTDLRGCFNMVHCSAPWNHRYITFDKFSLKQRNTIREMTDFDSYRNNVGSMLPDFPGSPVDPDDLSESSFWALDAHFLTDAEKFCFIYSLTEPEWDAFINRFWSFNSRYLYEKTGQNSYSKCGVRHNGFPHYNPVGDLTSNRECFMFECIHPMSFLTQLTEAFYLKRNKHPLGVQKCFEKDNWDFYAFYWSHKDMLDKNDLLKFTQQSENDAANLSAIFHQAAALKTTEIVNKLKQQNERDSSPYPIFKKYKHPHLDAQTFHLVFGSGKMDLLSPDAKLNPPAVLLHVWCHEMFEYLELVVILNRIKTHFKPSEHPNVRTEMMPHFVPKELMTQLRDAHLANPPNPAWIEHLRKEVINRFYCYRGQFMRILGHPMPVEKISDFIVKKRVDELKKELPLESFKSVYFPYEAAKCLVPLLASPHFSFYYVSPTLDEHLNMLFMTSDICKRAIDLDNSLFFDRIGESSRKLKTFVFSELALMPHFTRRRHYGVALKKILEQTHFSIIGGTIFNPNIVTPEKKKLAKLLSRIVDLYEKHCKIFDWTPIFVPPVIHSATNGFVDLENVTLVSALKLTRYAEVRDIIRPFLP